MTSLQFNKNVFN